MEPVVDHFPAVIKHFSNRRLVETTNYYLKIAQGSQRSWDVNYARERAKACAAECKGRHIRLSSQDRAA